MSTQDTSTDPADAASAAGSAADRSDDEITDDRTAEDTAAPSTRRRWPAPRRIVIAALVIAVVVTALVGGVHLAVGAHHDRDRLAAERSARDAACAYAHTMTDYSSHDIDGYIAKVLAGATGDFKSEFGKTSGELKQVIAGAQITSAAHDIQCGISSADDDHAEVVVAMGVSISSLGTEGKTVPSQISLVAGLDRIDGHWLVSKLDAPALGPAAAAASPPGR